MNNSKDLCLTVKGYMQAGGLSSHLFNDLKKSKTAEVVQIKGPMGSGLQIGTTGTHVAFAAGTGILPMIDLIAHLILRVIGEKTGEQILTDIP